MNVLSWSQVFVKDGDKDTVVLLAARASRVENQDAIDASIVGMLGDPKEVFNWRIFHFIHFYMPACWIRCYFRFHVMLLGKSRNQWDSFPAIQSGG